MAIYYTIEFEQIPKEFNPLSYGMIQIVMQSTLSTRATTFSHVYFYYNTFKGHLTNTQYTEQ